MNLNLLLPVAAVLHIIEEFIFPGGFMRWYHNFRPEIARSVTSRFLVMINAILIVACLLPMVIRNPVYGVALWLSIAAIFFTNAVFHIRATLKTKAYSPGTITAVLIYLPLSFYGYWTFIANGQASVGTAISSFIIGASYYWFSLFNHFRRSKQLKAEVPAKNDRGTSVEN